MSGPLNKGDQAALFQAATGLGNDELMEISRGHLEDGREYRAMLFTGDTEIDLNGDPDAVAAALSEGLSSEDHDAVLAGLSINSEQQPIDRSKRGLYAREAGIYTPEWDPSKLIDIYYDDPDFRACVDNRADMTLGTGFDVRQKPHIEKPDESQRDRLVEWLGLASGAEALAAEMTAALTDELVTGSAYLEVVRDLTARVDASLVGVNYARAIMTRVAKTGLHFVQLQTDQIMIFRKLGSLDDTPYALCLPANHYKTLVKDKRDWWVVAGWCTQRQFEEMQGLPYINSEAAARIGLAGGILDRIEGRQDPKMEVRATNEMMMVKRNALNDSIYGAPPLINAVRDWAGARYARQMNLNYFDNNTIPPLLAIATGDRLPAKTIDNIRGALIRNRGRAAFHKAVYVELPSGCELRLEPLTQLLQNDAGFQDYLNMCSNTIHVAMRTPRTVTTVMPDVQANVAENALRWFVNVPVASDQHRWSHKLNYLTRTYLGITDYEAVPRRVSIEDELKLAQIDELRLKGAVYCPNDVLRRLGMPEKPGGQFATKTIPGIGVILLQAVEEISRRVLEGERPSKANRTLASTGHDTPGNEAPVAQPTKATMAVGFTKDGWISLDGLIRA